MHSGNHHQAFRYHHDNDSQRRTGARRIRRRQGRGLSLRRRCERGVCISASRLRRRLTKRTLLFLNGPLTRVLNPPTTNTKTSTYTVAGVNPSNTTSGLVTKAQLTKGTWLSTNPTAAKTQVLVTTAYASQNGLKVGRTLAINSVDYTIVGLVNPTLTGDVSDIYFSLSLNLQSLSSSESRINEVLVSVANAEGTSTPWPSRSRRNYRGSTVLTSASLADQVTGSSPTPASWPTILYGGALAVVVLLAAFFNRRSLDAVSGTCQSGSPRNRIATGYRLVSWACCSPNHGRDDWHWHRWAVCFLESLSVRLSV